MARISRKNVNAAAAALADSYLRYLLRVRRFVKSGGEGVPMTLTAYAATLDGRPRAFLRDEVGEERFTRWTLRVSLEVQDKRAADVVEAAKAISISRASRRKDSGCVYVWAAYRIHAAKKTA